MRCDELRAWPLAPTGLLLVVVLSVGPLLRFGGRLHHGLPLGIELAQHWVGLSERGARIIGRLPQCSRHQRLCRGRECRATVGAKWWRHGCKHGPRGQGWPRTRLAWRMSVLPRASFSFFFVLRSERARFISSLIELVVSVYHALNCDAANGWPGATVATTHYTSHPYGGHAEWQWEQQARLTPVRWSRRQWERRCRGGTTL